MERTRNPADYLYDKYSDIVAYKVSAFSKKTGHEASELESLALVTFMSAIITWPGNAGGSFKSWLSMRLDRSFCDYARKNRPMFHGKNFTNEDGEELLVNYHQDWIPGIKLMFKEMIMDLSEEGRSVVLILLDSPGEVLKLKGHETPKAIRGKMVKHLRQTGWSWVEIWKTFNEIKEVLKT